jgi:hypothetical protein
VSREDIFKLWPRPWKLSPDRDGIVLDGGGMDVLIVDNECYQSQEAAVALAEMLVEWSNEKP